jgi:hypothetical protein
MKAPVKDLMPGAEGGEGQQAERKRKPPPQE